VIAVRVVGVVFDQRYDSPVVILQEEQGERVLPIFIGPAEATAIIMALENQKFIRPMTLDLTKLLLDALQARIARVIVSELKDDTFLASLILESSGRVFSFDARPSDSIGLALRASAPILVADDVMNAAAHLPTQDEEERLKEMQERLRSTNPEDIGNFRI
jgi:bifunctional DNase/RNase